MLRIKTFLYYIDSRSIYYKTPFLLKLILFFAASLCGLALKNYYFNAGISIVLLGLVWQSGFGKEKPFYLLLLLFSSITFCTMWLLLSRIPGTKIILTLPWGTFISDRTFVVMLSGYFRWILICLAGLFFLVISYQEELIETIIKLRFPYQVLLVMTIAFNTISFTLESYPQIQLALKSRAVPRRSLLDAFNMVLYIGLAFLMDNIKRISMLRISFFLDMDDIVHIYGRKPLRVKK